MYSLRNSSFMLIKRCPLTQITSISNFTNSYFMTRPTRVATSFADAQHNIKVDNKRKYVSVGGDKFGNFNIPVNFNDILKQSKQLMRDVKLSELKQAPLPAFWYGFSGLAPFVLPPVSFILFGYSSTLGWLQLSYGATICSFLGGVNWGFHLKDCDCTWETLGLAVLPQAIAWIGLVIPQSLGFVMVSGGLLVSAYCDLTRVKYPNWFRAMRLCLTIPAVISLFFAAAMCILYQ